MVRRVEKHIIKASDSMYPMLKSFCRLSKNLYNHANYLMRQSFFSTGSIPNYNMLDKLLKTDTQYPDYQSMPTAQTAQQTLRCLTSCWKAYFQALNAYRKNPSKFTGCPRPPKFLKKSGYYTLILTNQNCKLADGVIRFPKTFRGFEIPFLNASRPNFKSFQQVRISVMPFQLCVEIVYNIEIPNPRPDNKRYIGIDIGVDNLAAVVNTFHEKPFVINGRPLKSMNQYYNKRRAEMKSNLEKQNRQRTSKRLRGFDIKRDAKINDYMHKASRRIIDYCVEHDVSIIIIGKNDGWKQSARLGKCDNQSFCSIPHAQFIDMLTYKANEYGISVITTEESYTSGTSFIDDEFPVKSNYKKSRRVKRGLFQSNKGVLINADVNGAYQIVKKVIPDFRWDRGCVLHPYIVNCA